MSNTTVEKDVNGSKLVYRVQGSGEPLIYLHPFIDKGEWLPVLEQWSRTNTVYYPHHPGYGLSEENPKLETAEDMAFHYLDWLHGLGLEKFTLMGASIGGWIALEMAVIAPDKIDKLILANPLGVRIEGVKLPDIFLMNPTTLADHIYVREDLKNDVAKLLGSDSEFETLMIRNRIATSRLAFNPYFHSTKLPDRIHRVTMPVHIVWGKEDRLFPLTYGEGLRGMIPHSQFDVMDGVGHMPHIEQPEQFIGITANFQP